MNLETRLISNSNAFFTKETKQQIIEDEYQRQFRTDLMLTKKPLTAPTVNDQKNIQNQRNYNMNKINKTQALITFENENFPINFEPAKVCLLYTSPSPRDVEESRMPSSA